MTRACNQLQMSRCLAVAIQVRAQKVASLFVNTIDKSNSVFYICPRLTPRIFLVASCAALHNPMSKLRPHHEFNGAQMRAVGVGLNPHTIHRPYTGFCELALLRDHDGNLTTIDGPLTYKRIRIIENAARSIDTDCTATKDLGVNCCLPIRFPRRKALTYAQP